MGTDWPFERAPDRFTRGLLSQEQLAAAWSRAQMEKTKRSVAAIITTGDHPIVGVARDLGLDPQPSGAGPASWHARCPGGQHHLLIEAELGRFGCGDCGEEGGIEDLRRFVAGRPQ